MRLLYFLSFFFFVSAFGIEKAQIEIGGQKLTVEIANTDKSRSQGLMGRTNLNEGEGMLFVFERPEVLAFWMKNTRIPLSVAFFDENFVLINSWDMEPQPKRADWYPHYLSNKPALYALEVPKGWFNKNKIRQGMKFSFLDRPISVK